MKQRLRLQAFRLLALLLTGALGCGMVSCGSDSRHFKIDARFSQIDQGEFYLYSPDETLQGFDTVQLQGGRFVYSLDCERPGVLVIVFPNYSEQPIFVEPGKQVKIKGDVTHLKEMKVTGTQDNKLMNGLRELMARNTPTEMVAHARQFIEDHPASAVSTWLLQRYFLQGDSIQFTEASRLLTLMHESQPENYFLLRLEKQISQLAATDIGQPLPAFETTDVNGRSVSNKDLDSLAIIHPWASWQASSTAVLRDLNQWAKQHPKRCSVLALSLDGNKEACRKIVERDSLDHVIIVCDGKMLESPLVQDLGIYSFSDNIICKNGRIAERSLTRESLTKRIEEAD